jgi:anaerobic magnesium-protoporphyrin IX monomethyl ester cyclase
MFYTLHCKVRNQRCATAEPAHDLMNILLLNPPHPAIGSRIPHEHLPPLGLLALGGPLIDAGHHLELLDADCGPMTTAEIVAEVHRRAPQAVLVGHSGSTSAHPSVVGITRAIRSVCPTVWIVYGGVFPTYHWRDILESEPQIDIVVRGEGEETVLRLVEALHHCRCLDAVRGIAFRRPVGTTNSPANRLTPGSPGVPYATAPAQIIHHLDDYRIGWELIDHSRYSYWGDRRAVVVQFSRGCPHRCNYCGQRGFWARWRHRDPVAFARELARLHREHGVEVVNFADENPTASRSAWQAFLEALIAERVPLILVGSTRASDIVRDADILHLYRRAGVARLLMGMESTNESTLRRILKDSQSAMDREAIRLLRQHGILSMAAFVAGFDEETDRDYWRALRQIIAYDPDQIQALYATPHRWTGFYRLEAHRQVIQTDLGRWDYKHQVLATRKLPPWRITVWMKFIEAVVQLRPKALWRVMALPDPEQRKAMRWYYRIGRQVWPYELWHFLFRDRRRTRGPSLDEFLGAPQAEQALDSSSPASNGLPESSNRVRLPFKAVPREVVRGIRGRAAAARPAAPIPT